MTDDSTTPDRQSPDVAFDAPFDLPKRLPVELGDLMGRVKWWLESHGVNDPQDAPRAKLDKTVSVASLEDPACVPTAAAICGLLTSTDAAPLTAWTLTSDGSLDYGAWMRQCAAIRDQIGALRHTRSDAPALRAALPPTLQDLVDRLKDEESGCLVVDGPLAAGALLLAYELNPKCLTRIRPLQRGQSPVEHTTWDYLRIQPVVPLETGYTAGQLSNVAVELINLGLDLATNQPNQFDDAAAD